MMWIFALLVIGAIGAVAVVATGGGDTLALAYDDRPDVTVPAAGPLTSADLEAVTFTTAVRGYRASEVDALLERLAAQLAQTEVAQAPATETEEP